MLKVVLKQYSGLQEISNIALYVRGALIVVWNDLIGVKTLPSDVIKRMARLSELV